MKLFRKSLLFVCLFMNFISVQTSNNNELDDDETSFPQELDLEDLFPGGINFLERNEPDLFPGETSLLVRTKRKFENNQNDDSDSHDFDSDFGSEIDLESYDNESSQNLKFHEPDEVEELNRVMSILNTLNETSTPHETHTTEEKK